MSPLASLRISLKTASSGGGHARPLMKCSAKNRVRNKLVKNSARRPIAPLSMAVPAASPKIRSTREPAVAPGGTGIMGQGLSLARRRLAAVEGTAAAVMAPSDKHRDDGEVEVNPISLDGATGIQEEASAVETTREFSESDPHSHPSAHPDSPSALSLSIMGKNHINCGAISPSRPSQAQLSAQHGNNVDSLPHLSVLTSLRSPAQPQLSGAAAIPANLIDLPLTSSDEDKDDDEFPILNALREKTIAARPAVSPSAVAPPSSSAAPPTRVPLHRPVHAVVSELADLQRVRDGASAAISAIELGGPKRAPASTAPMPGPSHSRHPPVSLAAASPRRVKRAHPSTANPSIDFTRSKKPKPSKDNSLYRPSAAGSPAAGIPSPGLLMPRPGGSAAAAVEGQKYKRSSALARAIAAARSSAAPLQRNNPLPVAPAPSRDAIPALYIDTGSSVSSSDSDSDSICLKERLSRWATGSKTAVDSSAAIASGETRQPLNRTVTNDRQTSREELDEVPLRKRVPGMHHHNKGREDRDGDEGEEEEGSTLRARMFRMMNNSMQSGGGKAQTKPLASMDTRGVEESSVPGSALRSFKTVKRLSIAPSYPEDEAPGVPSGQGQGQSSLSRDFPHPQGDTSFKGKMAPSTSASREELDNVPLRMRLPGVHHHTTDSSFKGKMTPPTSISALSNNSVPGPAATLVPPSGGRSALRLDDSFLFDEMEAVARQVKQRQQQQQPTRRVGLMGMGHAAPPRRQIVLLPGAPNSRQSECWVGF